MKKLVKSAVLMLAAIFALFALACGGERNAIPEKDVQKHTPAAQTEPPAETEMPSEPPAEDDRYSLDLDLHGADALSEFFAALDKSDEEFDEYLRKMTIEFPSIGESVIIGIGSRAEAKVAAELIERIPFPIAPEYCFTSFRLTRYHGIYEYNIGYRLQGKGYDGIDLAWIDFSGALNGENSGSDALDRRLEGAREGFYYPMDAEETRITRLYGDNGIFANYKYFHAEIDGLFMEITTWQHWFDAKSFDFGNVKEALEKGLIRTFDAE